MRKPFISNVILLNIGMLVLASLLVLKLGYIQISKGDFYKNLAEEKYRTPASKTLDRGTIFFEEKHGRKISAATMIPDYSLILDPSKVTDSESLASKLGEIINLDREDFILRASHKNDEYEEISKHLSEEEAESIRQLKWKGIAVEVNKRRYYPGGRVAAQVLGFVGKDSSTSVETGRYGLEKYYNDKLERTGNTEETTSLFVDLFLRPAKSIIFDREREGDLITTIEPAVQGFLERVLEDDILKKYSAGSAGGIIMNPKNGEIYAMATVPTFDPNNFSKEKDQQVFSNPLVSGVYEMGSIIKPLTMAAGIDARVVTSKTTYDDKGFRIINKKRISNFDGKARGIVTMQDVLSQSLNTGSIFVEERLGKERFREYFKSFGLGEETGIDLPNEAVGDIRNLNSPRDIEYATASFGQGISTTPIATIRALATLANGGVLVTPHIVKRIEYNIGPAWEFTPISERRVIKKETASEISDMLTVSADKVLAGGALKLEHYSVAVKTGTAQIVDENGYSSTDFLHTFIGYFPSNDPKFIVLLILKNPRGEAFASHTLSLPFMQITKFLLNYYQVPPDR